MSFVASKNLDGEDTRRKNINKVHNNKNNYDHDNDDNEGDNGDNDGDNNEDVVDAVTATVDGHIPVVAVSKPSTVYQKQNKFEDVEAASTAVGVHSKNSFEVLNNDDDNDHNQDDNNDNIGDDATSNLISTIFSIPFLPKITGTPMHKSFKPNSPSNNTEQGNIFC